MLIEKMYQGDIRPRSPMRGGTIRMSLAAGCPRHEAYIILNYPLDDDARVWDGVSVAAMKDGNMHEGAIVAELITAGCNVWNHGDDQVLTFARGDTLRGLRYSGHPDLFTRVVEEDTGEFETFGIEVKGYRTEIFEKYVNGAQEISRGKYLMNPEVLKVRPWPIMPQVQLYLHSEAAEKMGVQRWVVILKNKNTAELAECIVEKDIDYLQGVLERWTGFWVMTDVQRLPKRFFSDDSKECERCEFFKRCWGVKRPLSQLPAKAIELSEKSALALEQASLNRRRGMAAKAISEELIESSRMVYVQEMINYNTSSIEFDGLKATISPRNRHGINQTAVKDLLERQLREGIITEWVYDSMWSDTEYEEVRYDDRGQTVMKEVE